MLSAYAVPRVSRSWLGGAALCATLIAVCLTPIRPGLAAAQTMRDVTDPQGRFTMSVPTDWTVRSLPYRGDTVLAALGPPDADGVRPTLTVYVLPQAHPLSSEEVAKSSDADLRKLPDYVPVGDGRATVAGLPAYYRNFTRTREGRRFYQTQVYVARGPYVYVISGTTLNDRAQIDRDTPVMLNIIGTLRVSGQRAMPGELI